MVVKRVTSYRHQFLIVHPDFGRLTQIGNLKLATRNPQYGNDKRRIIPTDC